MGMFGAAAVLCKGGGRMQVWEKNKKTIIAAAIFLGALFILWQVFGGYSASAVKVLDARISFQFTAYPDREEHFVAYSLENTKNKKVKANMKVRLGTQGMSGMTFQSILDARDSAVLKPLETKSFVTKFEIPKSKIPQNKELSAQVHVKRVARA